MDNQPQDKIPDKIETIQEANVAAKEPEDTDQQINWKKFKEARQIERQAKEAAEKLAAQESEKSKVYKEALEALMGKQHTPQQDQVEQSEDDIIQQKIDRALANERNRVAEENSRREQAEYPQRLVATYSDFEQVCNTENLDYLEYHHPEIAEPYKHMPDGYNKWQLIYKALKKYIPNANAYKEQKKAERNFNKPQSMAVGGVTQTLDQAPRNLNDKAKADNWARMQRAMKGIK